MYQQNKILSLYIITIFYKLDIFHYNAKTQNSLEKHRIVIWPDNRIPDIQLFEEFNIRLSGRIAGQFKAIVFLYV